MIKPDLSADAFLRRHQNPASMGLRAVATLLMIGGLWAHAPGAIVLAVLIETLNWLYMPERERPPEWLDQVLDMEFAWLDLPPGPLKSGLACAAVVGVAFLGLGFFAHHLLTIAIGLALCGTVALILRWLATR